MDRRTSIYFLGCLRGVHLVRGVLDSEPFERLGFAC